MNRDAEGVGGGEQVFDRGGARVGDGGDDEVIVAARRVGVFACIEEREKDAGHLAEGFIAQAGKDQGSGLIVGKLGEGGAEGPGSGGVVGDVKEQRGTFGEVEKFEAPGPVGVADSRFDGGVCDVVTFLVA